MKQFNLAIGKIFTVTVIFLLASLTVFAQNTITGKVINDAGKGIQGVTVTIKGTNISTQTDANGDYTINAPKTNSTLSFTSVGFTTYDVAASSAGSVSLVQSNRQLEDIVVVAYGTKKKSDLTGSVTSVGQKDFQKGNVNSAEQLLQGKVAGLEVTTGGGSAGGGSKIRIRGTSSLNASNDPLLVIDGVPVEGNGVAGSGNLLGTINPDDIETMSVLKDASATALYGSRATNGVIIITTKKGTSKKLRLNFNTKVSLSKLTDKVNVLTGDQVRQIVNEKGTATYKNFLGKENTDWQDVIYQDAIGVDNNLSASGIAQVTPTFQLPIRASIGYLNQEGILRTNKFDRLTTSLNLSPKLLNDHLSFNINAKYSNAKTRFADGGAIGSAVNFDPTQPVYSGDKKYGGYYEWLTGSGLNTLATRNPLALLLLRNNNSNVDRIIGNVQMDYKMHFLPDLHLLVNIGIDRSKGTGTDITDSTSAVSSLSYLGKGRKNQYEQTKTSKLADVQLFYQKDINSIKSKIDVLVGHGYQEFFTDDISFFSYYQNGLIDTVTATKPTYPNDRNGYAIDSYIGRLNYIFNNKYLLTASIRRDESSRFAPDNRVGYFPAVAVAWKLKEEFFKNTGIVSELKLRGSYGETGQQEIGDLYGYLPRYSYGSQSAQYQIGDKFVRFLRPSAYNPDIKWETTATTDIGLDFGFLRNRISGTVDVYEKKTRDLLSIVPVPAGANFDIQLYKNIGDLKNRGIEFALNTIPVQTKNLTWNLGFNVAFNDVKVTKLTENNDPNYTGIDVSGISGGTGNNVGKFAVGYSPFVYYVKKQVYDNNGKPIEGLYEDLDRDGAVNATDSKDRYYYKKPAADAIYGVSTNVSYKDFSFGLAGHGQAGNYLYNNFNSNSGTLRNILNPVQHIGNASVNYLETNFANNQYNSDYYIENASFFRLDNINLGYNFGKIVNGKASLRMSANVQNVFVVTKYSGLDPESASSTGVDNTIYPRPRIYTVGANVDF